MGVELVRDRAGSGRDGDLTVVGGVDHHGRALARLALEDEHREPVAELTLDDSLEWAGAERQIEPFTGERPLRGVVSPRALSAARPTACADAPSWMSTMRLEVGLGQAPGNG